MGHLPSLITDLALILITGAAVTLIFRKIKQPLVLGYIIAGLLVGSNLKLTPSVVDIDNVKVLAEIGVIFLLFSLGLEFSFKKLVRVGGAASITAFVEIIFISIAGYMFGKFLGWQTMDCLFLGGMLASSSTTIILRSFDDLGVKSKNYAKIVFGVLVVEDIVVILLMVILSTIAVTNTFDGVEMLFTIGKLVFFLVLWFLMGIYLLPSLLKLLKKILDDEALMLLSIGLCLGMVVVATKVGFSAELGAFIMGSILAETTSAERIEHVIKPVKELFGAIFFVSVGMLIDPILVVEYGWAVLGITLLTIFGKLFSTIIGAVLSGQNLKQAVQVGMSMAQIGEFAFIVATLGLSLGVISDFLFPIAVGASAVTTFTTPYMIKYSDRFYNFIEKILPKRLINKINRYSSSTQTIRAESEWKKLVKTFVMSTLSNSIILFALILIVSKFLLPFAKDVIPNEFMASIVTLLVALMLMSSFLWGLMVRKYKNKAYKELWMDPDYNRGPLVVMEIVRLFVGIVLISYLVSNLFSTVATIIIIVTITVIFIIIFSRILQKNYHRVEFRFLHNFYDIDVIEKAMKESRSNKVEKLISNLTLSNWDVHLVDLEISQYAEYAGKTLKELSWRENYEIIVVYIKRGEKLIYSPGKNEKILPFDHIGVIATDEIIQKFKPVFDTVDSRLTDIHNVEDIVLVKIVVDYHNNFDGISIKDTEIKNRTGALIIGIERNDKKILTPKSSTILKEHDIVWLVGDRDKLDEMFHTVAQ